MRTELCIEIEEDITNFECEKIKINENIHISIKMISSSSEIRLSLIWRRKKHIIINSTSFDVIYFDVACVIHFMIMI